MASNRALPSALVALLAVGAAAHSAEGAPAGVPAAAGGAPYVPLEPSFVLNFGGPREGRLQYLKADVTLRVTDPAAAEAARHHLPALRNALVLLLSRQDEGTVSSSNGREGIRAEALAEIRSILQAEEGEPCVEDVLFTNFIVQR